MKLILIIILLLGIFFRTYQVIERFEFAHDGDLYSWIVKDILIDRHFRLIGQETSASGIFIGPLFYYLITPFFLLTNFEPTAAIIPITIVGLLTILSYYIVFSKLFNVKVGLIISCLYAVLISTTVWFDRWIAPSTLSNLWVIWYFYVNISLARGDFRVLPLLGVLISLIWHIHIALLPSLVTIPVAILVSRKLPNLRHIIYFFATLIVTSIPLIIFEIKHNFQQTVNLISNFTEYREGARGFYKFQLVLGMISKNIHNLLFAPQSFKVLNNILFPTAILLSSLLLIKKGLLKTKEFAVLLAWFFGIVIFFSISSSPISEYYFYNIEIIFLAIISLFFYLVLKSSFKGKVLILGLLIFIALKNIVYLITQDYYNKGYLEKKAVVEFITQDSQNRNFPCFSVNYITSIGENVGFRYLFFLKRAKMAVSGNGSPVYSIVIPDEYAKGEVEKKFGHIGVITPKNISSKEAIDYACSGLNTNLTDPMFGYVE